MEIELNEVALEKGVRRGLTDQLRVHLGERRIKVVDRSSQDTALGQRVADEKKKSYAACVDTACQIPLGKALAATHLLRTNVSRFSTVCTLAAELIDLKAEVQIGAASARSGCKPEQLLDATERIAEGIVRLAAR
jgi:hypothetical protein